MACAPCAKKAADAAARSAALAPGPAAATAPTAGPSGRIAVYEVVSGGEVVTSTTSATAARQEAKRVGGSLRVTSRPAGGEELEAAGLGGRP